MVELVKAIAGMPIPFNFLVFGIIFGCVFVTIAVVATEVCKYASHRQDIAFKQEMVERGLSVEEIERIVKVRPVEPADEPATTVDT